MKDIITAPVLTTISRGLTVQIIEDEAAAPAIGEFGGMSVGAGHLPKVGGVIHIALHHPNGMTLAATLGVDAVIDLATHYNAAAAAINAGAYRQSETRQ